MQKKGHFQNAKICPKSKSKAAVERVEGELSDTDSEESVSRLTETTAGELVRNIEGPASRKAWVNTQVYDHGRPGVKE